MTAESEPDGMTRAEFLWGMAGISTCLLLVSDIAGSRSGWYRTSISIVISATTLYWWFQAVSHQSRSWKKSGDRQVDSSKHH